MRALPLPTLAVCIVSVLTTSARADEDADSLAPRVSAASTSSGMQSPAVFGTGLFLSSVGVAGLATGAYFFSGGLGACDSIDRSRMPSDAQIDACTSAVTKQVGGIIGLASGGAFFIAGIPAIAVGASSASANDETPDAPRAAVLVAPLHVELVVSF